MKTARDWFAIADVREKIASLPRALELALAETSLVSAGREIAIARDVTVVPKSRLPAKPGLSLPIGQARLLHDLASIELQAMELGVRTLVEFPEAPADFRRELADVTLGEGRHFGLCLQGMNDLGFEWGYWNVHVALLDTVSSRDSLLDRILIVHRYLEGSGLDAADSILKRLNGVRADCARPVVQTILREEVDHVLFGSRWYARICSRDGVDASSDFRTRLRRVLEVAPRREHIAEALRLRAGFTADEIAFLRERGFHQDSETLRLRSLNPFSVSLVK